MTQDGNHFNINVKSGSIFDKHAQHSFDDRREVDPQFRTSVDLAQQDNILEHLEKHNVRKHQKVINLKFVLYFHVNIQT